MYFICMYIYIYIYIYICIARLRDGGARARAHCWGELPAMISKATKGNGIGATGSKNPRAY